MRRTAWVRSAAALALTGLLVAACGSDRGGDDPSAAPAAEPEENSSSGGGSDGTFGDLESPCGEGDASSATDQGVTAESVVLGYGDDAGFPQSPGLNHEMTDAVEAFIDWCNEQGGINGRTIEGRYYDAAITNVGNAVLEACDQVFMLVGQGWALDSGQEETRVGCNLASVPAYSVSAEFAHGPMSVQPVPNPVDRQSIGSARAMAEEFPDEVKKAAVMFGNFGATRDTKDKVLSSFPEAGWEFLDCPQEYNIQGEPDWRPFVQSLASCGAELVYYNGAPFPNFQNFLEAAAQLEYEPIYYVDANFYVSEFAEWNTGGLADRVYVTNQFVPLEEAGESEATQQYVDIVEESGGDISQLGEQAASAFLLWATAADACGDDLTRECVMEELAGIDAWTGGGLHAETNPAENLPSRCSMLLKLDGTEFVRHLPEEPGEFTCSDDNIAEVTGEVVDRAELDADRVSTRYTG